MEIVWGDVALSSLERARRYIAEDNPAAGERVRGTILSAVRRLAEFPSMGRLGRISDTRELVVVGTPYVVAYAIVGDKVVIIAVQHGAQEWPERF
jgi:toxin ParE1/3/4